MLISSWLDIRKFSLGRSIVSMSFVDTTQTLFTSEEEFRTLRPMTMKSSEEYLVPGDRNEDGVACGRLSWSGGDGVDVNSGRVDLSGGVLAVLGVFGSSSSDGANRGFAFTRV